MGEGLTTEQSKEHVAWSGEDFRTYLIGLSHSTPKEDHHLELARFPKRIDLPADWHGVLGEMRSLTTQENREFWSRIGVSVSRDRVIVQRPFLQGEGDKIDSKMINDDVPRAQKQGIVFFVGEIHSHPSVLKGCNFIFAPLYRESFSIGDLYDLALWPNFPGHVNILVAPHTNLIAFRSRETKLLSTSETYAQFEKKFQRFHFDPELEMENTWASILLIAKEYHLALYRGEVNRALQRVLP